METATTALPLAADGYEADLTTPERQDEAVKRAHQRTRADNHPEADRLYLAAARAGSSTAVAPYGSLLFGRGEPEDRTEAIEWPGAFARPNRPLSSAPSVSGAMRRVFDRPRKTLRFSSVRRPARRRCIVRKSN